MCSQKECPTKFETRWLQEIPFSKERTDNYCALGLLFESIICNNVQLFHHVDFFRNPRSLHLWHRWSKSNPWILMNLRIIGQSRTSHSYPRWLRGWSAGRSMIIWRDASWCQFCSRHIDLVTQLKAAFWRWCPTSLMLPTPEKFHSLDFWISVQHSILSTMTFFFTVCNHLLASEGLFSTG